MSLRLKLLALGLVGVAGWWAFLHIERLGAAEVEARDARVALKAEQDARAQEKHDAEISVEAVAGLRAERDRLAADLASRPVSIRVCDPPSRSGGLPSAARVAGGTRDAPTPGGGVPSVPETDSGRDIGASLQLLASRADELTAQLRAVLAWQRGLHGP